MYYKDKKSPLSNATTTQLLANMQLLKLYYTKLIPANKFSRYVLFLVGFIMLIYFYKLTSYVYVLSSSKTLVLIDDTHEFSSFMQIQNVAKEDTVASSIIISALIKPDGGESLADRPIYSLVKPFVNGMYLYDMTQPIESWWPFDCIKTQMKQSVNTKLCIHDPKFDKYVR
jgi:hypothetical protein